MPALRLDGEMSKSGGEITKETLAATGAQMVGGAAARAVGKAIGGAIGTAIAPGPGTGVGTAVGVMVGIAVGIGAYDYVKYEGLEGKQPLKRSETLEGDLSLKDARKEEKKHDSKTPDNIQNPTPISPPGSSGGAGSGWGTWTPPSSGGFGVTNAFIANVNPNNVNVFRQTFDSTWKNAVTNSYEKAQTISAMQEAVT